MDIFKQTILRAHGDQKYGDKPYSYHLDAVVSAFLEYFPITGEYRGTNIGGIHDLLGSAVSYAHDVLEDTEMSHDALVQAFSNLLHRNAHSDDATVLKYAQQLLFKVVAMTDDSGHSRKDRKRNTYCRIREANTSEVKMADRIANHEECLSTRKYKESKNVWRRI